jgi:hypothetical protein
MPFEEIFWSIVEHVGAKTVYGEPISAQGKQSCLWRRFGTDLAVAPGGTTKKNRAAVAAGWWRNQ